MRDYKNSWKIRDFYRYFQEEHKNIDFDLLARAFKSHPNYESVKDNAKAFGIDVYIRSFLAYQRLSAVNKIKEGNPELDVEWIRGKYRRYFFDHDLSGRCFVYPVSQANKMRRHAFTQCDNLFFVDDIANMINFWYREFPKTSEERSELFRKIFGELAYGIVTTKDNIMGRARNFAKRGGYVVAIPMSKNELKEEVRKSCERNGLLIT